MSMKMPRPSEASVKAHREWSNAVDDLNALNQKHQSDLFLAEAFKRPKPSMSEADKAKLAELQATIARLEPLVERDFPL